VGAAAQTFAAPQAGDVQDGDLPNLRDPDRAAERAEEIVVYVFLRGGIDGLNLVSPGAGHPDRGHYEQARADIRIPTSGTGASLPLGSRNFAMHPNAPQLQQLSPRTTWQSSTPWGCPLR